MPDLPKLSIRLHGGIDARRCIELAKAADAHGFDTVWLAENTKPFEEVKDSLRAPLLLSQADKAASDTADKLAAAIRQSNKISLDDLARDYHLTVNETRPISATDPLLELANSQEAKDAIFD